MYSQKSPCKSQHSQGDFVIVSEYAPKNQPNAHPYGLSCNCIKNGVLIDAGTGIGKTFAYLAAGTVFQQLRAASGEAFTSILISTSSIALQNAVQREYLPLLSAVLMADGIIDRPLSSVIRKGKSHYVCDERLDAD